MRYLLLIYSRGARPRPSPRSDGRRVTRRYNEFTADIRDSRALRGRRGAPADLDARRRSGSGTARPSTTDGPFAETKEALGGFYLVDAKDLDEAIELAARIPAARHGSIEVRPIWDFDAADAAAGAATAVGRPHGRRRLTATRSARPGA